MTRQREPTIPWRYVRLALTTLIVAVGCTAASERPTFDPGSDGGAPSPAKSERGPGFEGDPSGVAGDPATCEEALATRTYVGCDYWPTVTGNVVQDVFDFAVVVANVGAAAADVKVTGPNETDRQVTVAPGALEKIYLPWVPELKGRALKPLDFESHMSASVLARKGAYHLVSSVPVVVYQFNPLEYAGKGGPPGKKWTSCISSTEGCLSYSNDASLLLPSTAWTGTYRVTSYPALSDKTSGGLSVDVRNAFLAITAAEDDTTVKVTLGALGSVLAGGGIAEAGSGGEIEVHLDAGDVAELVTEKGDKYDLSGSLVRSDKPVQVISGAPCTTVPSGQAACDHLEEVVLPAEALGKQYVVTTPTAPSGTKGLHVVRFVGNRDGTELTYAPAKPVGCPDTLAAGEVSECDGMVDHDFVVTGTEEFAVTSFMVGATVYGPKERLGDPSQTIFAATEQFRGSYLFLMPDDYDKSYAVVVGPEGAAPAIDGAPLSSPEVVGDGLAVWRAELSSASGGAHTLKSAMPVGLQAIGYGSYTSYQFPGGLDVKRIALVPPK